MLPMAFSVPSALEFLLQSVICTYESFFRALHTYLMKAFNSFNEQPWNSLIFFPLKHDEVKNLLCQSLYMYVWLIIWALYMYLMKALHNIWAALKFFDIFPLMGIMRSKSFMKFEFLTPTFLKFSLG